MEKGLYDRLNKPLVPGGLLTLEPDYSMKVALAVLETIHSHIGECYPERYGECEDLEDAIEVVKSYR